MRKKGINRRRRMNLPSWDWEDVWHAVGITVVACFVVLFGVWVFAPKNVDYYYLSTGNNAHFGYCVYAHWTWHQDEVSYCTDDRDRAIDFTIKANQSLPVRSK
jgi:hypothetical protein